MSKNSYLKEVFKEPPFTAFRRDQNLRGHIIKAKVARIQPKYQTDFKRE